MSDNTILMTGVIIEGLFWAAVLGAFIIHYRRNLQKNHELITELREKANAAEKVIGMNSKEKRRHYRLKLEDQKCTVRVIDFGDQALQRLNNKSFDVEMCDISQSGMKIRCSINFPIREKVLLILSFKKKDGTLIRVRGSVMRKEMKHDCDTVDYGIQFVSLTAKEETEIQSFINQKELAKKVLRSASYR
ncbi:PilZ domain-containing protein [Sporolactobacillus sp. CPB3-1]|uniref:PilZ domain-containing protein n=1 Tax=Sporolactobacillus mangiferae TaxID=2940498 RepID=A0ABT0MCN6_9BACL|nr:PilZ domain-containing protein [Sporolactobacillus mangiferae]MCL1632647.1 PilZ domain-containing protein [Sporolactobacillus mangiferae]